MRTRATVLERVRRFLCRENGTQLVELALALPVMLVLMGGITEFANFFYQYTTLTSAVRAGARHASKWERGASWMNGPCAETEKLVVYGQFNCPATTAPILPGLTEANVVVQANGPSPNSIDSVTVKIVNYRYQPLFDLGRLTGIPGLSLNINMNANATMHQLYNGPTAG